MQEQSALPRSTRLLSMTLLALLCAAVAHAASPSVWVTVGDDAFDTLSKSRGVLSQPLPPKAAAADGGVVVTRLARADLAAVSTLMHDSMKRCSGFIVHDSYDDAVAAMRAAGRPALKTLPSDFTIGQQTLVNQLLPMLDAANIVSTIDHLSTSYTNRYYQYSSGEQSALWIRDLWQGYATGRSDVTVTTYDHGSYVQPSVILTIAGSSLASEVVVLGGHLDSIRSGGMTIATVAPGADDNASGIAALSEAFRVLLEQGWTPDRTIKLMGYAAEEVGLLGSGDIAADHQSAGTDVVAVMQLDMTDFMGSAEDVALVDDFTNADLSAFVGTLLDTYQPSLLWTTSTCGYACSDHASWHNRGYPAVMPFESRVGQHNSALHTSNDTLATLGNQADHALKFAKLALSFAVETGMAEAPGPGNPQDAVYDAGLGAPACATAGSSCDSTTLLDSRGTLSPAEPNQPNTLDACADGGSGSYHSDESLDRLVVSTLDDQDFAEGATVRVDATVYAWSTGSSDHLDLYYAADANNPSWTLIATLDPPAGGSQTLSAQYTLPAGSLQAVRANFRYQGSQSSCSGGNYDDADDLVFAAGGGTPDCTVDADCDDGLWCNGAETCAAGTCQAGTARSCDDGLFCNGAETCNESTDSCDAGADPCGAFGCDEAGDVCLECAVDADCDDGAFCNGAETCAAGICQAGSDPCPGQSCDEAGDVCSAQNGPQDAVYDAGLGAPACTVAGSECDSLALLDGRGTVGPEPNQPNTLDSCTDGTSGSYHSDESNDRLVVKTLDGADMTEGATVQVEATVYGYSTGTSDHLDLYYAADATSPSWTLITTIDLSSGGVQTLSAQYTLPAGSLQAVRANFRYNGSQSSCSSGSYDDADDLVFAVSGGVPECAADADCDDGLFCNGAESCGAGSCQAGSDPCPGQSCDEGTDTCVPGGGCAVDDDFESGTAGWVNDPSSTCSTGAYVTGNPTNPGGGQQIAGSHSGSSSIFTGVNTSAGNADVDGGNCVLASPSWPVASASTLSVWYWHGQRDAGDDASGDFFSLEVSIDGGSTWTTLASNGDTASTAAWTEATAPIPAGSNVELRMQCSDGAGPGDLIECGIDDVSICN